MPILSWLCDHFFALSELLVGGKEFARPVDMDFVDRKKAYDCVPEKGMWEVLEE